MRSVRSEAYSNGTLYVSNWPVVALKIEIKIIIFEIIEIVFEPNVHSFERSTQNNNSNVNIEVCLLWFEFFFIKL